MRRITLPRIGTHSAWREAARGLLAEGVAPSDVLWSTDPTECDLFAAPAPAPAKGQISVPRSFADLASDAVWHSDPQRFARLYALLVRVAEKPVLMTDRGDAEIARLQGMAKAVRRCAHKMTAFVRFREVSPPDASRRSFVAWFEPTHHTLEPTSTFFARRFGDMDWSILTPDINAHFRDGTVSFAPGQPRPPLPEDATEDLWRTYFANIFNPARLRIQAMQSEMPKKYWHNMPEADLIPGLIAGAGAKVQQMRAAAPTLAPAFAANAQNMVAERPLPVTDPDILSAQMNACTRCPIHANATQAVPGEGPLSAPLMIVGEQPGDAEDLAGRSFVGPAGQLFDRIAAEAGLDRKAAFVTNAVKHFKFRPSGKRRLHQTPNAHEIQHCRWWLDLERKLVQPQLLLALGGTAAEALTGSRKDLMQRRGRIEETQDGLPVFLTVHPSYLLRLSDPVQRSEETDRFRDDLRAANSLLSKLIG